MLNKPTKYRYTIRTIPANDNEKLEELLNSMADEGWEIYTMQEAETDEEILINCIFIRDYIPEEKLSEDNLDIINFKTKMERIMEPQSEPYDMCIDIMNKIKEKRMRIAQVKLLLDSTSEDSRGILNDEISKNIKDLEELKQKLAGVISPNIMEKKLGEVRLSISISEELMDLLNPDSDYNIITQIVGIRQNLTNSLGYIIPKVKINLDDILDANEFSINVRGIPVIKACSYFGYLMYFKDELNLTKLPKNSIKDVDIITGKEIIWIEENKAKDYWVKGLDTTDYVIRLLEYASVKYIDEIFDYSDINRYIEIVGTQNMYLVENIIPDFISVAELKFILTSLIKEKVSIKDILYIFEKINDFSDENNKEELLAKIRISLGRQISQSLIKNNEIKTIELSATSIKNLIGTSQNDEIIRIENSKLKKIATKIKNLYDEIAPEEKEYVLLTTMDIRHVLYLVLSQMIPNIRVIAREEILYEYPLKIIGTV